MHVNSSSIATRLFYNGWQISMGAVGQSVYSARLLQGFARHSAPDQLDTTILCPSSLSLSFPPLRVEQISVRKIGNFAIDGLLWDNKLLSDRRLWERNSVFFSPGAVYGLRAPPRMAITYHDCIYRYWPVYHGRSGIRRIRARLMERYLHRAQRVFTESVHAQNDIAKWTGVSPEKISVIPAWLPPEFSPENARAGLDAARARYHLPERYWLYIGGYDVRKNVEHLIRAYARARSSTTCPPLVLAGRVPRKKAPYLCDVAGARAEANLDTAAIIEPGFIEDADLPALYAGAELLIFPSLMEGYGLSPLEAMGCGCPAVVADNSSLREVVRDADYRFDTASLDSLTDILVTAARKPLPLNPSFRRDDHDERAAIQRYLSALTALGAA